MLANHGPGSGGERSSAGSLAKDLSAVFQGFGGAWMTGKRLPELL
jgi:hypothetical protein